MRLRIAFLLIFGLNPELAASLPPEPVKIGLMSELSGSASTNGQECRRAFELAWKTIAPSGKVSGRTIELIFGDNKGDAKAGLSEFKKFTEIDRVLAVVTTRSQVAMPLNPLSKNLQIPLLATIGHPDFVGGNPFAYRFWPNSAKVAANLASWIAELRIRGVAVVTAEDEYTLTLATAFKLEAQGKGIDVPLFANVPPEESDFSPLIAKVKNSGAPAIFVNLGLTQQGGFIRRLREQQLPVQIIGNSWTAYSEIAQAAGFPNIEGAIYVDSHYDRDEFVKLYRSLYPASNPVAVSFACYTALGSVLQAIQRNPAIDSRADLQSALQAQTVVELPDGPLAIENREANFPLVRKIIKNGVSMRPESLIDQKLP